MTDTSITSPAVEGRSLGQLALLRFRRNKPAMGGCVILLLIALFSFVGPLFSSHSYDQVFSSYVSVPPSLKPFPDPASLQQVAEGAATRARLKLDSFTLESGVFTVKISSDKPIDPRTVRYFDRVNEFHDTRVAETSADQMSMTLTGRVTQEYFFFGTDSNGRDLMVRVMLGGQISIAVGLAASLVSLGIGVIYGATSGYLGGRVDNIMMRIVEILYSLPFVFLVVVMVVFFGRSILLMFLVIGAVQWLEMARIVRGQTLSLKRREFVGAAEALGLNDWQIIRRHIIPNTIGPVIVFVTVVVPQVILTESFLSFLGLGVQAPLASWGTLISDGAQNIQNTPWLLIFPAVFFVVTLFSLNFVGDGLRDALDPKDR
ncbi:ABC transporter permease [Allorhizobium taibaishanense]|uniref:Oligopeptide transport system permease protein OppC n=1 Tax=Allorhizobium taibaishanense TaxID=887144 RepID=A0A1Q8ZZN0_9HYPH|nr:ABC transporter permease subunit [Allorhizobium taibaishanense]MBB4007358.1 oligopeptide transport system permease protein [Allorhizobium taibaishanense]OLP47668.1 peptide ABC transporter permease [Allorhizobium taibaishanense]